MAGRKRGDREGGVWGEAWVGSGEPWAGPTTGGGEARRHPREDKDEARKKAGQRKCKGAQTRKRGTEGNRAGGGLASPQPLPSPQFSFPPILLPSPLLVPLLLQSTRRAQYPPRNVPPGIQYTWLKSWLYPLVGFGGNYLISQGPSFRV